MFQRFLIADWDTVDYVEIAERPGTLNSAGTLRSKSASKFEGDDS